MSKSENTLKYIAIIFDLDGVICHTDNFHYMAWKQIADRENIYFDERINNRLRGVKREDSFEIILERSEREYSKEEKTKIINEKNEIYKSLLKNMSSEDVDPDVIFTLNVLKSAGILLGIGSSSKNARLILEKIGLGSFFDAISDGVGLKNAKPDPEVFIRCADLLGVPYERCLVVEDAVVGVEAAKAAGMDCAAVGDAINSKTADYDLIRFSGLLDVCHLQLREIPKVTGGDMPGDVCNIEPTHLEKFNCLFPPLWGELQQTFKESAHGRAVVSICGGSGTGKTECAQLLKHMLSELNIKSYALSGDNYPYRIPKFNDAERLNIFRHEGINELIAQKMYSDKIKDELLTLQKENIDSDPTQIKAHPWLKTYQEAGDMGLSGYLGTHLEHDFTLLSSIISEFKKGANSIFLKRMGREVASTWFDCVDFSDISVLIIEWTHGSNDNLHGVDIPVLLYSTPDETLAHRKKRARDKGADSPFISRVLNIEAELLKSQAHKAKIIVSNQNTIMDTIEI